MMAMPKLVRWYIRAGLVYLVAALLAGLLLAAPGTHIPGLTPVYFHLLMVGWATQLILGVAYWMFPRYSKEAARGPTWLGVMIFAALNLGLLLRAAAEPLQAAGLDEAGWLLAVSALLQMAAGWMAVAALWPRVRER